MQEWFSIEKIDEDTFAISEYKHWEETHCYLLIGTAKALLIDTGLGVGDIGQAVKSLTSLPIEAATTHIHWDHIGGHKYFKDIAVHEKEKDWIEKKFPVPLENVKRSLLWKPCEFPDDFQIEQYQIYQGMPSVILKDRDCISLGNREISIIHTPGHSPGHICFYESERQFLYSGDLIYEGCLDIFYKTTNPIEFMQSVKKVKRLPIKKVLPGHHRLDISVNLISEIDTAFTELEKNGKLEQGNGIFEFGNFQIHL